MVKKNKIMIGHNAVKELDGGIYEIIEDLCEGYLELYGTLSETKKNQVSSITKIQEFKNKIEKYKGKNGN